MTNYRLLADLRVCGCVADRPRAEPDADGVRRQPQPEDLPAAVRQLLRLHLLHRLLQGEVCRLPGEIQQIPR